jgi:hypothetical protein
MTSHLRLNDHFPDARWTVDAIYRLDAFALGLHLHCSRQYCMRVTDKHQINFRSHCSHGYFRDESSTFADVKYKLHNDGDMHREKETATNEDDA